MRIVYLCFPNYLKNGESYFLQLFNPTNPIGYMLSPKGCKGFQFRVWENWGKFVMQTRKLVK